MIDQRDVICLVLQRSIEHHSIGSDVQYHSSITADAAPKKSVKETGIVRL